MLALLKHTLVYDAWVYLRLRMEMQAWYRRGRTAPSPHLVKQRLLHDLALEYSLGHLVETGTYMGTMVAAMKTHFSRIDSVELDPYLARRASKRFANFHYVHIHQGNSESLLPSILATVTHPALFWLDAHFSGGITARADRETPIETELRLILQHGFADRHVIVIDDARLFDGSHDYPTLDRVREIVLLAAPVHCVDVRDDIIRITPHAGT